MTNKKLDFLIAGGMKCGSTSLSNYLGIHKNIAIPEWEVGFFNRPERRVEGYDYYEAKVGAVADEHTLIRGEKTPYANDKRLTPMIWKYNPDFKLIFIFRNPVDRAWSNYVHDLWNLEESRSFEYCLEKEAERPLLHQYLSKGHYAEQVEDYLSYFDRHQMYFILFDDFIHKRQQTLEKLFSFLDVSAEGFDFTREFHSKKTKHPRFSPRNLYWTERILGRNNRIWNWIWRLHFKNAPKRKMKPKNRQRLLNYYKPHNQALSTLLNRDLSTWST